MRRSSRRILDWRVSERALWLIGLRWLVLSLVALAALLGNHVLNLALPAAAVWITLAGVGLYNLAFWLAARSPALRDAPVGMHATLLRAQIIADLVALTVLLHFSGGIENPFSPYYLLLILIGSILMTERDSYTFATVGSLLWAGLLLFEAAGILPHHNLRTFRLPTRYQEWSHVAAEITVLGSAAFVISYLTSSIVARLRESERRLYVTHADSEARANELDHLNVRLQEMDLARMQFMRLVTHELRAPVAAIQSYLRLIIEGYVPAGDVPDIIVKAEQRANDQLELISDLLDLAHMREPHAETSTESCDAIRILEDVLDMMQGRIEDKRLTKRFTAPSDLPLVLAPPEHVKQVWTNLISNAVKYTHPDGTVTITVRCDDGMMCASVQDTGIGISPEDQQHIFQDFYRTEQAKAMSRHGTGLGLSIVKGIVEGCGGTLTLQSNLGEGSTFSFTLPVVSEDLTPAEA